MDNLTHTMVGAALGQAGLKRYTGLGMATLMIAANIPDVDVLSGFWTDSLAFRRGWTHGPVGLLILPALLTAAMIGFDSWQQRRGTRPEKRLPVRALPLLVLAYAGALTHPFLDWLNTYGIRFLMPFSHEWYYGDAVFIIDPWIWLALAAGLFISRRRERRGTAPWRRPALITLIVVTVYVGLMIGGSRVAAGVISREIQARGQGPIENLMAGPVPINPFQRDFIADRGRDYLFGLLTFGPRPNVAINQETLARNDDHPLVLEAMDHQTFQDFLFWSRFPYFRVEDHPDGVLVSVGDARFARMFRADWAARSVVLEQ